MTLCSLIEDLITGTVTGVAISVFFYRKSLLDPVMQKLLYCDPTTEFSNRRADRDSDGLNFTQHYLNSYKNILANAGMKESAEVVREIVNEIAVHTGTLPQEDNSPERNNRRAVTSEDSQACESKKRRWLEQVVRLYALRPASHEFLPMVFCMAFGGINDE